MTRAGSPPGRPNSRSAIVVAVGSIALVLVAVLVFLRPGSAPAATTPSAALPASPGAGAAALASPGAASSGASGGGSASRSPGAASSATGTAGATGATAGSSAGAHATRTPPASPSAPGAGGSSAAPSPAAASGGTASATPSGAAGTAPTSATGFDPRHTLVPITFPLQASARYRYAALWRTPRLGVVYPYNQIRGVGPGGVLLRAHDGVDIQVAIGTLVVAPFAGVVVDPAAIWKPWDPQRYGKVVVVRSTEATSRGYYAILVHLSRQSVQVGQAVRRAQVVGRTGITGNAGETTPHLHFELRTPFPVAFHYGGVLRWLDDFDPLPSLRAADPNLPH